MKIVARKNNLYTLNEFEQNALSKSFIDAVGIDVIMTVDGRIVVFNPVIDNIASILSIQNSTFIESKNTEVILLEDFLRRYQDANIKVFINVISYGDPIVTSENVQQINERSRSYIRHITEILAQFPSIEKYVYSGNRRLLTYLMEEKRNYKVGVYLSQEDLSFLDVDFYLFATEILNMDIIMQQLDMKKEIALIILNCEQIQRMFKFFDDPTIDQNSSKRIFKDAFFITNYPEIFYSVMAFHLQFKDKNLLL